MSEETRECRKCNEVKPIDDFYLKKSATTVSGFHRKWSCKACDSSLARQWSKGNPDRARLNKWRSDLKVKYGINEEQWWEIFDKQGGCCAICEERETSRHSSGTVFRMSVDHCHTTGKIRGILCNNCNRAVGLLKDNAQLLRKAADYLER